MMVPRYSIVTFIFSAICLLFVACAPTTDDSRDGGDVATPIDSSAIITLERTACFGTCPIYQVTIYGDGRVVYDGREHVDTAGEQTAQIDPLEVQALIDFMVDGGYQELKDNYTERFVSDMPSIITSLTINGETKRIDHYWGDDSAPLLLLQVENRIDLLAESGQWTGQDLTAMSSVSIFGQLLVHGTTDMTELPEGSIVTIRLEDVSLLDAPSVVISELIYEDLLRLPVFYDFVVDLNTLDPYATYNVSADVVSADGELIYWTDTAFEVLNRGAGHMVDIVLVSAE